MAQKPQKLEDVKLIEEGGEGGRRGRVVVLEDGGPRVLAEGLPRDMPSASRLYGTSARGSARRRSGGQRCTCFMDAME